MSQKRVVTIGGGTGQFTVLSGLKRFRDLSLTAVVSMADSGGGTGVLRVEQGVLPTGDLRQGLVALSEADEVMLKIMNHRYQNGKLDGQNMGNLILACLQQIFDGDMNRAMEAASQILNIRGQVLPVTLDDIHLAAELANGQVITGEHLIDEPEHDSSIPIKRVFLKPSATINPPVVKAIEQADLIVMGPGDLFTSILPNLLVQGMVEAIWRSQAKVVYVCNVMTKVGQTDNFTDHQHATVIESYLHPGRLTAMLVNTTSPTPELARRYEQEQSQKPVSHIEVPGLGYEVVCTDLLSTEAVRTQRGDKLKRSLVRHDPHKLAAVLYGLL